MCSSASVLLPLSSASLSLLSQLRAYANVHKRPSDEMLARNTAPTSFPLPARIYRDDRSFDQALPQHARSPRPHSAQARSPDLRPLASARESSRRRHIHSDGCSTDHRVGGVHLSIQQYRVLTVPSDEILNGKIADTNTHYFARYCFDRGIDLCVLLSCIYRTDALLQSRSTWRL